MLIIIGSLSTETAKELSIFTTSQAEAMGETFSPYHRVREVVSQQFESLASQPSLPSIQETLLIRQGHYCGHRFQQGELTAVWFFEEAQLKVYRQDGSLANVVQLARAPSRCQAA